MAISSRVPRGSVQAKLNFFQPPSDGAKPYNNVVRDGPQTRNYGDKAYEVTIDDIRGRESEFNLDNDAFLVVQDVPPSAEKDFVSDDSIKANYYPELEKLLLSHIPGSNKVIFFDHTIRRTDPHSNRKPVQLVHIDQTAASAAQRVRRHAESEEEAERLLAGRYRIVNVWRPLNKGPVESFPLAVASSASLRSEDVVPVEHRYESGYTGQTAAIKHDPAQKWHYLSGMTGSERLLLQCFDSDALKDGSVVKGGRVPHTAFEDPRTHPDAEGRESIEVRALVFGP